MHKVQNEREILIGEKQRTKMEFEEEVMMPVSPSGQYLNSSAMSLSILSVLEFEVPIDDLEAISLLSDLFIPISHRFSSIMVEDKNGIKRWKKVEVNIKHHVKFPKFPAGKSTEYYGKYFRNYLSQISMDPLPQYQPLWEVHVVKYPTSTTSAGNLVFKLHHALGDGYSLMGALLSCLKRADDPNLPLTFPSRQSNSKPQTDVVSYLRRVPQVSRWIVNTVIDFGWSLLKSSVLEDDISPIRSGGPGMEFLPMGIATMEFSLERIKQIKTNLKVTINDVITGVVILGTRLYMEGESEDAGQATATALVLLNTRNIGGYKSISEMVKPKSTMPWGNHFAFLHLPLPKLTTTDGDYTTPNPLDFVYATHEVVKRKRNNAACLLTGGLLENVRKIRGPETTASYIHSTMKNSSLGITSLIGPVEKMSLCNHPISGLYFAVLGVPQSLGITVLSYVGKLIITIGVEKDYIDIEKFKSCILKAYDTMFKAAVHSV